MRQSTTVKADDPWAVVTRAVALGIAAEAHADRDMTSQDKARRPSKRPREEPVRAGHYEEFFTTSTRTPPSSLAAQGG